MSIESFVVKSRLGNYNVFFQEPAEYIARLLAEPNSVFVVDENVWRLHKGGVLKDLDAAKPIALPIGEGLKSLESVQTLYDRIVEFAPKKNMRLVSIGGGITQDITGFVASTLYRGVKWTFIPTTLLAQADSCIGGKTSLNYRSFKNLIGTFYPPSDIYISTSYLSTLKDADYLSGLGEIAKLCIIGGEGPANDFAVNVQGLLSRDPLVLTRFLHLALEIKKDYIEDDEFDSGRRNILNFGHCFGHAIESATDFAVPHGLAVVYGILLANSVARRRRVLSVSAEKFMAERILNPLLGGTGPLDLDSETIIQGMKKDKKRTGVKLALVMALDGYKMVRVNDLEEAEASAAVADFNRPS